MAYSIRLTTDQQYQLADLMQTHKDKRQSRRLLAISLRHFGYSIKEIGLLTHVSDRTVSSWMKLFYEGGFDALLELKHKGNPDSKLTAYHSHIKAFFAHQEGASLKALHTHLVEEHQLSVDYSWLTRYMKVHFPELLTS